MKNYYLTDIEINDLKSGLMSNKSFPPSKTKSNKNSLSKSFSSLYKQNKNSDNGHFFEENIKNILKIEYECIDEINDTHFFYRTIGIENKKVLIKVGYSKKLKINGRKYKFILYPNQSLSIFRGYINRRFITNISEKTKETKITLNNTKIIISEINEIEIDAFYKITSDTIEKITKDDNVICLYKNINDDKPKDAEYACCEIKLSMDQINKLIKQLEKDKIVLENIIGYKKLIYIGFVGNGKITYNLLCKLKKINDLDLLIFQIKNCNWLKRNLTHNIDWETYSLFKSLKNENALLKEKVDTLNEKFDILIELVKNALDIKDDKLIGKKSERK